MVERGTQKMKIYDPYRCAACYFRTAADFPARKSLLQVTERCNLHCAHCFVSSSCNGLDMDFKKICDYVIPNYIKHNVKKVTITGGEPLVYPELLKTIDLMRKNDISICICTNASLITSDFLHEILPLKGIHFNVSLDGFSHTSHGKFRGNDSEELYDTIIKNITMLGEYRLLNGILVTPNNYSSIEEYEKICTFAKENNAKYVLFNPLSEFGRGEGSSSLAYSKKQMNDLHMATEKYDCKEFETVFIRFPNINRLPLNGCSAGNIFYIFTNGDVAFCPYMVFAAKNNSSIYDYRDFLMGNIFDSSFDWETNIENYKFPVDINMVCKGCDNSECLKGCYAAKIAMGNSLLSRDEQICPIYN